MSGGSIGRLGELYGLSPATLAGLANVTGDVPAPAPLPAGGAPVDPNSFEAWSAGQPADAVRNIQPGQTYGDVQGDKTKIDPAPHGIDPATQTSTVAPDPGAAPPPAGPEGEAPEAPAPNPYGTPGSAPIRTVPAHWQAQGHTVTTHRGMSGEELEPGMVAGQSASRYGIQAAEKSYEAAQQSGFADGIYSAAKAHAGQVAADQIAAINERKQQYVVNEQRKLEEMATRARAQVDPDGLWKEKGTGAEVAAAIMIGIGQFATMWTGRGENMAFKIIDGAINRNVAAQQTNINNAKDALHDAEGLYERNLAAFGDKERAAIATKINYLDGVASMVDGYRANVVGQTKNEAAYATLQQRIQLEQKNLYDEHAKLTHTQVQESGTERFIPAQTVGGGAPASRREGNLVTMADGTTYHFDSPELAKEAAKKLQAHGEVKLYTNKILALRNEVANLDPITDKAAYDAGMLRLKQLDDKLVTSESIASGQGVVTKADIERREAIGLNATAGLGTFKKGAALLGGSAFSSANNAYQQALKDNTDAERGYVQTAGGSIYKRDYQRDAAGNLVPTGSYTGQDAKPPQRLAPRGATPMNPKNKLVTDDEPDSETTPRAPVRAGVAPSRSIPVAKKR